MICGILIAAGRGRRMGQTKQLVKWNSKPLIAAAFDAVAPICDQMIVVLGHEEENVSAALEPRNFLRVTSDPDAEMFTSIKAGLRASLDACPTATCLLQLGDHPQVEPETLQALVANSKESPDLAILPTYEARGGHPILIPSSIASQIVESAVSGGLRMFWKENPQTVVRIDVSDPGIVLDIDTPEDLAT